MLVPSNGESIMHNRARMRISNRFAIDDLLEKGFDQIWLKPHTARNDYVHTQKGTYMATDLWNLFDGICFGNSTPYFMQIKTNAWAKRELFEKFQRNHDVNVLNINVTNKLKACNNKWRVFVNELHP